MICEKWFPTPIWYGKLSSASITYLNSAIKYCLNLKSKSPSRVISNRGGWQGDSLYDNDIQDTPLMPFFNEIDNYTKEAFFELGIDPAPKFCGAWVNINKKNDYNLPHIHPVASLSGVFYLTQNNSAIVFNREASVSNHHLTWLGSNNNTPLSYTKVSYTPKQGDFLLFPAWLEHFVEPSQNDEERISIAFNYSYT